MLVTVTTVMTVTAAVIVMVTVTTVLTVTTAVIVVTLLIAGCCNSMSAVLQVGAAHGGSTVVTGLKKYTRYEVVAKAFNNRGAGPLSPPVIAATLEDGKAENKST